MCSIVVVIGCVVFLLRVGVLLLEMWDMHV